MAGKQTSGPWHADRGVTDILLEDDGGHIPIADEYVTVYLGCEAQETLDPDNHNWVDVFGPDQESNARLIAAAPELLGALQGLVDVIDKAGLLQLSRGVELGQTSWYIKASDGLDCARTALSKALGEEA